MQKSHPQRALQCTIGIPNNTGGFGDVEKASRVFVRNEIIPLQKPLEELNDWLGDEIIRFPPYELDLKN